MKGCGRGEGQRIAIEASGAGRGWDTHAGMAQCHRRRFRAPARCRSETGAPAVPAFVPRLRQRQEVAQVSRSRAMPVGDRRSKPSRRFFAADDASSRCASRSGAGPQREKRSRLGRPVHPAGHERVRPRGGAADSDRGIRCWERMGHSRWHGAVSSAQVSRSRAMPVGDRRSGRPGYRSAASAKAGSGAGFALPRDAGRRPALQAVPAFVPRLRQRQEAAQVSRFRAMPVGDRRSSRLRVRSAASAKAGSGAGFALPRDAGRRPALRPSRLSFRGFGKGRKRRRFRAPARCRSETGAPAVPAIVPRLR